MTDLRALLVTPLSGPLADFGSASAAGLRLWAEQAADLPSPWQRVLLQIRDAHPDAAAAMREGLRQGPQLVFGPYGSGPALRALAATERLVWNHGGASPAIRWPAFSHALNVLAPSCSYFRGTLEAVRDIDPDARRVVILHTATGFGLDVGRGAAEAAQDLGFEVSATGFAAGRAGPATARLPDAEVLLVAGSFEDELEVAPLLLRRAWRAVAFVGAGVDEVLAPLGRARSGLLGPAQWTAATASRPDEGPDVEWFAQRYRSAEGHDAPYPAAQAFAAGVLAARCLRDCGKPSSISPNETQEVDSPSETAFPSDAAQRAAARQLVCRTLFGEFRLDPQTGIQVGHQVVTVQWQEGRRRVIWPPERAEAHLRYPREL